MTRSRPRNLRRLGWRRWRCCRSCFAAPAAAVPDRCRQTRIRSGLAGTYLAARTADVEKDVPNAASFYRSALKSDPENVFLLERALVLSAAAGEVGGRARFRQAS